MSARFVALLVLLAAGCFVLWWLPGRAPVGADDKGDEDAGAREIVEEVVAKIRANDVEGILKSLKGKYHNAPPPGHLETLADSLAAKRVELSTLMGKPLGEVEFVRRDLAGKSVVRYLYIDRHQRGCYVWAFTLYKGSDGWGMVNFTCSDQLPFALPPLAPLTVDPPRN